MSERGRIQVRNPAEAIAMAKCWLATWAGRTKIGGLDMSTIHVAPCAYCEEPRDFLIRAVEEFSEWGQLITDDEEAPMKLEIEQWLMLPASEQERLVTKAAKSGTITAPVEVVERVKDWWNQE